MPSEDSFPDDLCVCGLSRGQHHAVGHSFNRPQKGSASSLLDERCGRCGHTARFHFGALGCNGCAIALRGSESHHAFVPADAETAGEPEAPTAAQEAAMDELTHLRQEMEAQPPRRPPYAVAYALEGGAQYEIALPGDATIRAEAGALIITHASAVLALTQARPMEG